MIDVANYRFPDPMAGVQRGYEFGNALRQDSARQTAGNALRGGDYGAAAGDLYGAGLIDEGAQVQTYGQGQQDRATRASNAKRDDALKFMSDAATRLSDFHHSTGDVNKTLAAFDQMAPQFQKFGETPEELAQVRQQIASDPDGTLVAMGAGAAKQLGYDVQGSGDEVLVIDKKTGKLVNRYRGARTRDVAEGASLVELPGSYGDAPGAAQPQQFMANDTLPHQPGVPEGYTGIIPDNAQGDPNAVWAAMKHREWGGQGPAPDSPQGAIGSTQMLPATAEAMARKIGVPWRPDLMRGDTPNALAYQEKLGRAYYDEGLQKYGGDTRKAAMYYHGGPNEGIWGPKTQAYGDAVSGAQPYEVASNGETPPPPSASPRVIMTRPKPQRQQEPPAGYQWAPNGALAFIPGGPADPATQATNTAKNTRKAAGDLRKEFNARPEVKEYRDVATSFRQIQTLATKPPTAAGDLSLIFSYMKMLDPGSVVREGEFATAQNAAGIPEQVQNLYNKALSGQRLNPKQRGDFLAQARSINDTRVQRYGQIVEEYRGYASDYGIDPDQVSTAPDLGNNGKHKPAGWTQNLPPAQREAAMRFKGATGPAFSAENPAVPTDEAEYNALPKGAHYIHPSGAVKVKP